jgi:hypothetical protein
MSVCYIVFTYFVNRQEILLCADSPLADKLKLYAFLSMTVHLYHCTILVNRQMHIYIYILYCWKLRLALALNMHLRPVTFRQDIICCTTNQLTVNIFWTEIYIFQHRVSTHGCTVYMCVYMYVYLHFIVKNLRTARHCVLYDGSSDRWIKCMCL